MTSKEALERLCTVVVTHARDAEGVTAILQAATELTLATAEEIHATTMASLAKHLGAK